MALQSFTCPRRIGLHHRPQHTELTRNAHIELAYAELACVQQLGWPEQQQHRWPSAAGHFEKYTRPSPTHQMKRAIFECISSTSHTSHRLNHPKGQFSSLAAHSQQYSFESEKKSQTNTFRHGRRFYTIYWRNEIGILSFSDKVWQQIFWAEIFFCIILGRNDCITNSIIVLFEKNCTVRGDLSIFPPPSPPYL